MAPGACGELSSTGITGVPATIINYHPLSPWKSWHRCAALCLGESPAQARLKCLDLRCSFEALVKAEYGGPRAEGAAIEVLALIDWAAEYVEISRSPVPEILGFLRRPFVKGKMVKHPIPYDLAESIHKEKCVRTKAQKAWTYLCALLQFWMDEATTESGEVMYGGRCRPANPMIAWIRATLNPSFGDHFKITWASIAASTSWTQSRLYYGEPDRERFRMEAIPTADLQNPLEAAVEERWERYLQEGVQETADLGFSTPSWAGAASRPNLPSGQPEARHPTEADSMPPGSPVSIERPRKNRKPPGMKLPWIRRSSLSTRSWGSRMLRTSMKAGMPRRNQN